MKKATYYLSAMLIVASFAQPASAQFEGKIVYNNYEYSPDGSSKKQDKITLHITPKRIMLQGDKKYDFLRSIKTEGVLARLDYQDFVILTGKDVALKISKADITSMMKMFGDDTNAKNVEKKGEDISYKKTGDRKEIKGYNCEKFIFKDKEEPDAYTSVWMTKDIDVNWGMLAEPWSGGADAMFSSFPTDVIFKEKYFPVSVEAFKKGKLNSKMEATEIDDSPVAAASVQVPNGVKLLGFQQYLFQKMSQQ